MLVVETGRLTIGDAVISALFTVASCHSQRSPSSSPSSCRYRQNLEGPTWSKRLTVLQSVSAYSIQNCIPDVNQTPHLLWPQGHQKLRFPATILHRHAPLDLDNVHASGVSLWWSCVYITWFFLPAEYCSSGHILSLCPTLYPKSADSSSHFIESWHKLIYLGARPHFHQTRTFPVLPRSGPDWKNPQSQEPGGCPL